MEMAWSIKRSWYVFKDRWLTIRADECEDPRGRTITPYYVIENRDWVHIVAFDKNFHILLTEQYRHGLQRVCYELPCGEVETSDNSPEQAMRRELLEETGCQCESIRFVRAVSPNPAKHNNLVHCFMGFNASQVSLPSQDETESINFDFYPLDSILDMIDDGKFIQSLHIATLFLVFRELAKDEELPDDIRQKLWVAFKR